MRRRALQIFWPLGLLLLVAGLRVVGCRKSEPAGAKGPTPRARKIESRFTPPPPDKPVTYPPGVVPPAPTFPG